MSGRPAAMHVRRSPTLSARQSVSASRTGRNFACASASSASGSESATMPQPANSRTWCRLDLGRAQGDAELAVAVGVHPADRAGVAAAVHALDLGDQLDRHLGRGAADRGRRVQRRGQLERRWRRRSRARRRSTSVARCITLGRCSTNGTSGTFVEEQYGAERRRRPSGRRTRAPRGPSTTGPAGRRAPASRSSSPVRRIVPASTREVTRPRSRRTSISGVAPNSPSTWKVQHIS